jgi:hypothetical protein
MAGLVPAMTKKRVSVLEALVSCINL